MDPAQAIAMLSALAHSSRLAAFRCLIQAAPEGLLAGELAEELMLPKATLSFHLAQLERAQLVGSQRTGRTIRYRADSQAVSRLANYLLENCCTRSRKRRNMEQG
jgi:DNA-binding transcriptional ArsR family regulator